MNGDALGEHNLKPRLATNSVYLDDGHPSAPILPVNYPDVK